MSTRTVLVLLLCCWLAAGCGRPSPGRQVVVEEEPEPALTGRDLVIHQINKLGGKVTLEQGEPDRPAVVDLREARDPDAALRSVRRLGAVRVLDLSSTAVTDEGLAQVAGLTSLRELSLLAADNITSAAGRPLGELTGLRKLNLEGTKVRADGLAWLKHLARLEELNLALTAAGEAELAQVNALPSLRSLNLHGARLTDQALAQLKGMKQLRVLRIDSNSRLTDAGLVHLKGLTNLETLYLQNTTDAGLAHLKGLSGLRQLYLYDDRITEARLRELCKALPALTVSR